MRLKRISIEKKYAFGHTFFLQTSFIFIVPKTLIFNKVIKPQP